MEPVIVDAPKGQEEVKGAVPNNKVEEIGRSMASDIMNFGVLVKANQMGIKALEEKFSWLANEVGELKKSVSGWGETGKSLNERLAKQEELGRILGERLSAAAAKHEESEKSLNERLSAMAAKFSALSETASRQGELGKAILAVVSDLKARMGDYPTRGEIGPLWKQAQAVMLDDLNRQRNDLRALLANLSEDYHDGALSEKTYAEAKAKSEEKLAAIEDKIKKFASALAEEAHRKAEPRPPVPEGERLVEAKLAELKRGEEQFRLAEKNVGELRSRMDEFTNRLSSMEKKSGVQNVEFRSQMAELEKKAETLRLVEKSIGELKSQAGESANKLAALEKKSADAQTEFRNHMAVLDKTLGELKSHVVDVEKNAGAKLTELWQREDNLKSQAGESANKLAALEKKSADAQTKMEDEFRNHMAVLDKNIGDLKNYVIRVERKSEAGGGFFEKILGPRPAKMPEPKMKLEAPLAPAITPPPSREEHLKRELEELESTLDKIKSGKKPADEGERKEEEGRNAALLIKKLREQRQELEGLLKMIEQRHAEGMISDENYEAVRSRTLARLEKMGGLLGRQS